VRLKRLTLTNFRNYARLELAWERPLTVLQGENAQGKSNLLEAIYLLATSRSPRAGADREIINWLAAEDVQPYARIDADVERADRAERVEITILKNNGGANGSAVRKQIRINGVNRRAIDLLGHFNVVLFVPQDVDLVAGSPSLRRRYLDITLCQINPKYCRALSEYNQVIVQRSHLLRRLRERAGDPEQLHYWDETLMGRGAEVMAWRRKAIQILDGLAGAIHDDLAGGRESLHLRYQPSLPLAESGQSALDMELAVADEEISGIRAEFARKLPQIRRQEILQGACLAGPHRDDIRFIVNEWDLQTYGSRGQQRTAALSLKLAETQLMERATGEHPVLLLDDVLSELDAPRRQYLLKAVTGAQQAVITTTDFHLFPESFLSGVAQLQVTEGRIRELNPGGESEASDGAQ